jgi:hypothetical protein
MEEFTTLHRNRFPYNRPEEALSIPYLKESLMKKGGN